MQDCKSPVVFLAVALVVLAGCAAQPASQPAAPAAAAAPAPAAAPQLAQSGAGRSAFDGTYRGSVTTVGGGSGRYVCRPVTDGTVVVRNGIVRRTWLGAQLQAPVQPDGSFSG